MLLHVQSWDKHDNIPVDKAKSETTQHTVLKLLALSTRLCESWDKRDNIPVDKAKSETTQHTVLKLLALSTRLCESWDKHDNIPVDKAKSETTQHTVLTLLALSTRLCDCLFNECFRGFEAVSPLPRTESPSLDICFLFLCEGGGGSRTLSNSCS